MNPQDGAPPEDPEKQTPRSQTRVGWAALCGPGLLACLADTDVGCIMVAFKSGACQGYVLVSLQLILMAVLLLAQELTIRLGVHTGKSLTVLIKESYGPQVAWCFVIPLVLYCEAQAIEQFTGLMSVGKLWGVHPGGVLFGSATVVFGVGTMLRYEQVERFAIMIGLTQLIFVVPR